MKIYWPLVIFLPLVGCAGVKPVPEAPKSRAPLNIQSPPPVDGIMFVPAKR